MNVDERIRLEGFRQLKKEIRGSEEYLIVGIDIAKDKHNAFFGTATGETLLRRLVFENNIEGFGRLRARTEAMKNKPAIIIITYNFLFIGDQPLNSVYLK